VLVCIELQNVNAVKLYAKQFTKYKH